MITIAEIRAYLISAGFDSIKVDIFLAYHRANRHIWQAYQAKAFELITKGASRLSSKAIFEKLREDADLQTDATDFKLSNDWTSFYARVFAARFPQHGHLFEFKAVGERLAA